MSFKIQYLEEPYLKFANEGEEKDPRIGLLKYGPRTPTNTTDPVNIKVGLIGSNRTISETQKILNDMRHRIIPESGDPERWKIPFPGTRTGSPLKITLNTQKRWRQYFLPEDYDYILSPVSRDEKVERLLENINEKMQILVDKETPPDIILVSLPESIYEKTKSPAFKKPKLKTEESDFRSRIKLFGMDHNTPTQLIHPFTLQGKQTQDRSDIAWNLIVGVLYKSQKGHPWKLSYLEQDTCYAGISFYFERGKQKRTTKASMAQVFLDTGESFILRGDQVKESVGVYQNHLAEVDAIRIVEKILEQYRRHRNGAKPERLVVHKSSEYWEEEKNGMLKASSDIDVVDLVTIRARHPFRLFTDGDYPVLRGTLLSSPNYDENYLYTTGYIPSLGTYPGHRIPVPIQVVPDEDAFNTPIEDICNEILAFSKLDWNSSHFCKKLPVTIEVSQSVGDILAEIKAQERENIDSHYYFYM